MYITSSKCNMCESDCASVSFGFGHYVARKVDLSPMHVLPDVYDFDALQ